MAVRFSTALRSALGERAGSMNVHCIAPEEPLPSALSRYTTADTADVKAGSLLTCSVALEVPDTLSMNTLGWFFLTAYDSFEWPKKRTKKAFRTPLACKIG